MKFPINMKIPNDVITYDWEPKSAEVIDWDNFAGSWSSSNGTWTSVYNNYKQSSSRTITFNVPPANNSTMYTVSVNNNSLFTVTSDDIIDVREWENTGKEDTRWNNCLEHVEYNIKKYDTAVYEEGQRRNRHKWNDRKRDREPWNFR